MKLAIAILLSMVSLVRSQCSNDGGIKACIQTFTDTATSIAMSGTTKGLCDASQSYIDCMLAACPDEEIPEGMMDQLNKQLKDAGLNDCVLSKSSLMVPSLLLLTVAILVSFFMRR